MSGERFVIREPSGAMVRDATGAVLVYPTAAAARERVEKLRRERGRVEARGPVPAYEVVEASGLVSL